MELAGRGGGRAAVARGTAENQENQMIQLITLSRKLTTAIPKRYLTSPLKFTKKSCFIFSTYLVKCLVLQVFTIQMSILDFDFSLFMIIF